MVDDYETRKAAHLERIRLASGAAEIKAYGPKKKRRRRTPGEALACGCRPESIEQRELVREAHRRGLTLAWTRGERRESLASREWAKQMGARDGMPDLLVLDKPGLAIELKARCGRHKLTRRQEERIEWLRAHGWEVIVAHGAEDALCQLERRSCGVNC